VMVKVATNGPEGGDKLMMFGTTVKFTLLLAIPPAGHNEGPVDAPFGMAGRFGCSPT